MFQDQEETGDCRWAWEGVSWAKPRLFLGEDWENARAARATSPNGSVLGSWAMPRRSCPILKAPSGCQTGCKERRNSVQHPGPPHEGEQTEFHDCPPLGNMWCGSGTKVTEIDDMMLSFGWENTEMRSRSWTKRPVTMIPHPGIRGLAHMHGKAGEGSHLEPRLSVRHRGKGVGGQISCSADGSCGGGRTWSKRTPCFLGPFLTAHNGTIPTQPFSFSLNKDLQKRLSP